jgi:predicted DNA-binding protein
MTVRKNFLFRDEVARHLEEIARHQGKTQTQVVQEAIEVTYGQSEKESKLAALDALVGSMNGKIGDMDIKEARAEYLAEKYGY